MSNNSLNAARFPPIRDGGFQLAVGEAVVNIVELAYPVCSRDDSNEQYIIYQGELTELDGSLFRVVYKIPKELLYKDGKMVDVLDVPYSKYIDHYEWRS